MGLLYFNNYYGIDGGGVGKFAVIGFSVRVMGSAPSFVSQKYLGLKNWLFALPLEGGGLRPKYCQGSRGT
jgi:hypothetical protein